MGGDQEEPSTWAIAKMTVFEGGLHTCTANKSEELASLDDNGKYFLSSYPTLTPLPRNTKGIRSHV